MIVEEVPNIKEAIKKVLIDNPKLSKYRLAKDLNLSTSTHINNYLSGDTKKARKEVYKALLRKYSILVEEYKEDPDYKKSLINDEVKEIKVK